MHDLISRQAAIDAIDAACMKLDIIDKYKAESEEKE